MQSEDDCLSTHCMSAPAPLRFFVLSLFTLSLLDHGTLLAQRESYLLGPGSKVGPATEVKPKDCITAENGEITCDTELVNPVGDTPARPQFELFNP
jgi:hypothetical protein